MNGMNADAVQTIMRTHCDNSGQEMSKVYDETGRELYMGADREHD